VKTFPVIATIALLMVSCGHKSEQPTTSGDSSSAPGVATPEGSAPAKVSEAVRSYTASLADGNSLGSFFKYDVDYQSAARTAQQQVPTAMWPEKERQIQKEWQYRIAGGASKFQAAANSESPCESIIRPGVKIDGGKLEIRSLSDGSAQAFVPLACPTESAAITVSNPDGHMRKLKSVIVSLAARTDAQGQVLIKDSCKVVENTLMLYPVPQLSKEQAEALAKTADLLPTSLTARIQNVGSMNTSVNVAGGWNEFVAKAAQMKTILEKHGWQVTGLEPKTNGYYLITGTIAPTDRIRKWVTPNGDSYYNVVLLAGGESTLTDFKTTSEDSATATFHTKLTQPTEVADLYKDFAQNGLLRTAIFDFTADLDNYAADTKINYAWSPGSGWSASK
jgi:hypothetical protein